MGWAGLGWWMGLDSAHCQWRAAPFQFTACQAAWVASGPAAGESPRRLCTNPPPRCSASDSDTTDEILHVSRLLFLFV